MKFPITREYLQAFDPVKEREDKIITDCLNRLCQKFEQNMSMNYPQQCMRSTKPLEKRFVYEDIGSLQRTVEPFSGERLPRFIRRLRETFIGCDITMDPLKTYILIDWS